MGYEEREGVMTGQARQKVEIGGESIESLTISLGGGSTFQGRVTVSGPGSLTSGRISVALSPVDEDEQLGGHGRVKKDGTFEVTSVKDGNYAIRLWGLEHDWYVKSVRLGADDILEKGLQVEKGASGGRLEIVVSSGERTSRRLCKRRQPGDDRRACSHNARTGNILQPLPFAQRKNRPGRPLLDHWSCARRVSCICKMSGTARKRFPQVGPTTRHTFRTCPQDCTTRDREAPGRVDPN